MPARMADRTGKWWSLTSEFSLALHVNKGLNSYIYFLYQLGHCDPGSSVAHRQALAIWGILSPHSAEEALAQKRLETICLLNVK